MEKIETFAEIIEYVTRSKKRKHFVGGLLMSAAFFFAGLAITTFTLSLDEEEEKEENYNVY